MTPIHKTTTISLILTCELRRFRMVPLVHSGSQLCRSHSGSSDAQGLGVFTHTTICFRELHTDVTYFACKT